MSTHDPLDLRGQDARKAELAEKARFARDQEIADVKWLMQRQQGRRIIWRLLDQAGVFRLSFNTNAMQMAFAEGNRNAGLRMQALIHECCPELYPVMVKEQTHDD